MVVQAASKQYATIDNINQMALDTAVAFGIVFFDKLQCLDSARTKRLLLSLIRTSEVANLDCVKGQEAVFLIRPFPAAI